MGARFDKATLKENKANFLAAFATNGNKRQSAASAGISERTLHTWIAKDAKFSKLVVNANCKYLRSAK